MSDPYFSLRKLSFGLTKESKKGRLSKAVVANEQKRQLLIEEVSSGFTKDQYEHARGIIPLFPELKPGREDLDSFLANTTDFGLPPVHKGFSSQWSKR
jgi:hypothetical protein